MKEIHYFVADDGKRFEDEDECMEYEFQMTIAPKLANCRAFNSHFSPIELNADSMLNNRFSAECIFYIYIGDEEGFNTFSELYSGLGYACPADNLSFNGPMFLHYNDSDEWEDLEEIIRDYQSQVEEIQKYI